MCQDGVVVIGGWIVGLPRFCIMEGIFTFLNGYDRRRWDFLRYNFMYLHLTRWTVSNRVSRFKNRVFRIVVELTPRFLRFGSKTMPLVSRKSRASFKLCYVGLELCGMIFNDLDVTIDIKRRIEVE